VVIEGRIFIRNIDGRKIDGNRGKSEEAQCKLNYKLFIKATTRQAGTKSEWKSRGNGIRQGGDSEKYLDEVPGFDINLRH